MLGKGRPRGRKNSDKDGVTPPSEDLKAKLEQLHGRLEKLEESIRRLVLQFWIACALALLVATIFGIDYRGIRGMLDEAKNDLQFIRDQAALSREVSRTIEELKRVSQVDYPHFSVSFLKAQLASLMEEFSINGDRRAIVNITQRLNAVRDFFEQDSGALQSSDTQPLAVAFQLIERIIEQQRAIRFLPRSISSQNQAEIPSKRAIRDELQEVAQFAEGGVSDARFTQLFSWIIGTANLLLHWHGIDATDDRLAASKVAYSRGLQVLYPQQRDSIWTAELRSMNSLVYFRQYVVAAREVNLKKAYLDSAISTLVENVREYSDWDPATYNNLADYTGRLFIIELEAQTRSGFSGLSSSTRDTLRSHLLAVEGHIRRAIAREPGRSTFRATLFEVMCLKYALWDSLGVAKLDIDVSDLKSYLRDIFSISYESIFRDVLFRSGLEVSSPMMAIVAKYRKEIFDELRIYEESLVIAHCDWAQKSP